MAHREIVYAAAALSALVLAGGTNATESWPQYAPRCAPPELAVDAALQPPLCGGQVTEFGPRGPLMMSRSPTLEIETTGSIDTKALRRDGDDGPERL